MNVTRMSREHEEAESFLYFDDNSIPMSKDVLIIEETYYKYTSTGKLAESWLFYKKESRRFRFLAELHKSEVPDFLFGQNCGKMIANMCAAFFSAARKKPFAREGKEWD